MQLRGILQTNYSPYGVDDVSLQFNSDSGSNYAAHELQGNGSSAYSASATSQTSSQIAWGTAGTTSGNGTVANWGAFVIDILDYTNTSKNKTVRILSGNDMNGTGYGSVGGRVDLVSALWMSTNAINSITFSAPSTRSFTQYSSLELYGVN